MSDTKNNNNVRFYEIDLLRFLAAMSVVLFHYTFRGFIEGGYSPVEYPVIGEYSRYGYLGIHLFFMISGFVILLSAMNRGAIQFVIARFIRLYPAFWASVSLSAVIFYFFGGSLFSASLPQYFINMTMLSGLTDVKYIDNVYWSLLVELKFYVLIFMILLINRIKQIEVFLGVWLLIVIADTFLPLENIAPISKLISFFFFPEWALYFIAGALFYLIYEKGINLTRGIMLLCTYLLVINLVVNNVDSILQVRYNSSFSSIVPVVLISLFFLFFMMMALGKTAYLRFPLFINLGILTYPLYLIHQNIGYIAFNLLGHSINNYVFLIALISVMLMCAWLIHKLVEKKVEGFLHNKSKHLARTLPN